MDVSEKRKLRDGFFKRIGQNVDFFKEVLDLASDLCINMKDANGRIMALNRKNCEVCNVADEWDAIGLRSTDLFSPVYANTYMALDNEALQSGVPVRDRVTCWPADRSNCMMISNLYPLKDNRGRIVGTLHAYRLSRDVAHPDAIGYRKMRAAFDYIQAHYAETVKIDQLAQEAGMSISSFKREFKRVFEISPGEYLQTIRLNAVRTMLETTDASLATIAAETGFFDQSHLTRIFKKHRGMSPGQYRLKHAKRAN